MKTDPEYDKYPPKVFFFFFFFHIPNACCKQDGYTELNYRKADSKTC